MTTHLSRLRLPRWISRPFIHCREPWGQVIDWETLEQSRASSRAAALPSQGLNVIYTGVVPIIYKAQRTLLTSLIESIGWAFVMIAGVMMVLLRSGKVSAGNLLSVRGGMLSMFPNVFPVGCHLWHHGSHEYHGGHRLNDDCKCCHGRGGG